MMADKALIVRKKHVGRPIDFTVENRQTAQTETVNGRVVSVRRGIATIHYWLTWAYHEEPYTTYLAVNDPRIKAVY